MSETEVKRTIKDKSISAVNSFRYAVTERIVLQVMRARYSSLYDKIEEAPLISVYTPTYNRGELLLERAVPSILKQTYKNFEFVIVGDCCTDNTEELVSKIDDPRVRFYNLPKRGYRYPPTAENHWLTGPVVPANEALKILHGKWIARTDDDDIWTPDHLEVLLRFALNDKYEFVSAQHIEERYGKKQACEVMGAKDSYYTRSNKPVSGYNPKIGGTQTWLYRSYLNYFKYNINCWRKSWNRVNDVDLSIRMFKAGVTMGFLEQVVTYVLPRPGEDTIGLEAYKATESDKMKHFEFK
jgi:glycosyltransferase involved in cell wall biosynthesis